MAYFVASEVQTILTGGTSDTTYDALITQEGPYADVDVENDIFAHYGVSPPYTGADITKDIKTAANWRTAARVFGIIHQLESKKDAMHEYDRVIAGMKTRFKATPTTRTKIAGYTTPYRSSPLKDE